MSTDLSSGSADESVGKKRARPPQKGATARGAEARSTKRPRTVGVEASSSQSVAAPSLQLQVVPEDRLLKQLNSRVYGIPKHNTADFTVKAVVVHRPSDFEWSQLSWSLNGAAVESGETLSVSRSACQRNRIVATYGTQTAALEIWVFWATVEIKVSDGIPASCHKNFKDIEHAINSNPRTLGVTEGEVDGLLQKCGRICATATFEPAGLNAVLTSGLRFRRKIADGCEVVDGTLSVKTGDDTSDFPLMKQWTLNTENKIFDLDAPNIAGFSGVSYTAETYLNFQQWVEFHKTKCSDDAPWYFVGEFLNFQWDDLNIVGSQSKESVSTKGGGSNPKLNNVHVGNGRVTIPTSARYQVVRGRGRSAGAKITNTGKKSPL